MKLISKIYREIDEKNLSRLSFVILILSYYVFHIVVMLIITMFNVNISKNGIGAIFRELGGFIFIPANTIFLVAFCYIMFIRAYAIQTGMLRKGIMTLIVLSVLPFLLFCLKDEFVSNPERDLFPIALRYIYFKEDLSVSLGFNWQIIDILLPLLLLLPKNKVTI
ncbi:hypothetical protein KEQ50_09695 [Escherichia coli]|nr:hypothetical protein [Escherichia coli]